MGNQFRDFWKHLRVYKFLRISIMNFDEIFRFLNDENKWRVAYQSPRDISLIHLLIRVSATNHFYYYLIIYTVSYGASSPV